MNQFFSTLETKRDKISHWSMALGSLILFFLASLLVTAATSFFLGFTIGKSQFISSVLMALGLSFDLVGSLKIQGGGKNIGLKLFGWLCLLIVVSIVIETPFYDISFDGQNYHQEGIIQLKEGWNPHQDPLPTSVNEYTSRFTGHFAKGSWYIDACFFAVTGFVQSGKASNVLYIIAGLLITLSITLKVTKFSVWQSFLLSSLLAFNPIWANQFLSFYVDGQVSTCLLVLLAIFMAMYMGLFNRYLLLFVTGSTIILLSNLKFTGPIYAAIFTLGYCVVLFVKRRPQEAIQSALVMLFFGIVAVAYVGYGTYVTNILSEGHPFFPINTEDILGYQTPSNFKGVPSIVTLFQSIFSESGHLDVEAPARLKIPFSVSREELKIFVREEPRIGGFGPFFGGCVAIILSAFLYVWLVERKRPSVVFGLVWATLFLSVVINSAAWWARYVPQMYFLVVWMGIWVFLTTQKSWVRMGCLMVFIVLLLNTIVIKAIYTGNNILKTLAINEQLNTWKGKSVRTDFGIFQATRRRLIESNIPFEEIKRADMFTECSSSAVDMVAAYGSVKVCTKK